MKKPLAAFLIVVTAVFIAYKDRLTSISLPQKPGIAGRQQSDTLLAYLDQLETRSFDDNGALVSRLQTARARQYTGSPLIEMTHPVFSTGQGNRRWQGRAHSGTADSNNNMLTLENDVVFHQPANAAKIHTEKLVIDRQQRRAHTDRAVEISANHSQTTAEGMQIDFDAQTIQLQGNVHTRYQPPRNTVHTDPADKR